MLPLLASLACLPTAPPLQRDVSLDRAAELAALVDLPRAQDRHKAALELAADEEVSLEQWPAACRAFPPRGEAPAGSASMRWIGMHSSPRSTGIHAPPSGPPLRPAR